MPCRAMSNATCLPFWVVQHLLGCFSEGTYGLELKVSPVIGVLEHKPAL